MAIRKFTQGAVLVASLVLAPSGWAQSAFSSAGEITPADAAGKFLQPTTTDHSKSGLSTEIAENGTVPAVLPLDVDGTDKDAYVAEAGALKLINCSGAAISVKTFNSNDGVLWVPYQTIAIADLKSALPKCATSSCKLVIGGVRTAALSGYQVFVGNQVRATNSKSFTRGCPAYVPIKFAGKLISPIQTP